MLLSRVHEQTNQVIPQNTPGDISLFSDNDPRNNDANFDVDVFANDDGGAGPIALAAFPEPTSGQPLADIDIMNRSSGGNADIAFDVLPQVTEDRVLFANLFPNAEDPVSLYVNGDEVLTELDPVTQVVSDLTWELLV